MRNPLKKIIAVFILIALLPVGFIVYELSTLNKNERIIRDIYQNQLDAILYSINQYSDDVVSGWANRIGIALQEQKGILPKDTISAAGLLALMNQLSGVQYFYISDLKGRSATYSVLENKRSQQEINLILDNIISRNETEIKKLIRYHEAGFKKMETLDTVVSPELQPVFFAIGDPGENGYHIGVLVIDLPYFIKNVLGPKMQTISQQEFVISAFEERNDSLIYSTESINPGSVARMGSINQNVKNEGQKKDFWLLPGHYLGITLKGATIDDLVKSRVSTSMIILFMLLLILSAGIYFLYRNIRKEINLSQAKSEFVSNVSHEIRTPLSLISMYAETLEMDRVSPDKKKEYYGIIAKETARLSRIVNRILNFSQVEANRKTYNLKREQLNHLCMEVYDSYLVHARDKGFSFELIIDEKMPLVLADRESILEAVINLVDNAIKYSSDTKSISIRTGVDDPWCFIAVQDQGIGIPKNHQSDIFEQFFRAPTGDVHNTKGSGLGLTLVKKTMEAHHGKIKVVSAPGKGSTFTLYFPLKLIKGDES